MKERDEEIKKWRSNTENLALEKEHALNEQKAAMVESGKRNKILEDELSSAAQDLQNALAQDSASKKEGEDSVSKLKLELAEATKALQEASDRSESVAMQLGRAQMSEDALEKRVTLLEGELSKESQLSQETHALGIEVQSRLKEAQENAEAAETRQKELETLRTEEAECTRVESELQEARMSDLETRYAEAKTEIQRMKGEISRVEQENVVVYDEKGVSESNMVALTSRFQEAVKDLESARGERDEFKSRLAELQRKHKALGETLKTEQAKAIQAEAVAKVERDFLHSEVKHAMGQVAAAQKVNIDMSGLGHNAAARGGFILPPSHAPMGDRPSSATERSVLGDRNVITSSGKGNEPGTKRALSAKASTKTSKVKDRLPKRNSKHI